MNASPAPVGFIGAGQMGWPMVNRLRRGGFDVLLYARRPEVLTRAHESGVSVVDSSAEIARRCSIIVTCLYSTEQLAEVFGEQSTLTRALRPGTIVVSHTTGDQSAIHELDATLAKRSASLLDAPVSGTAKDIENGLLTVLLGGDHASVEALEPVIASYASHQIYCGTAGQAQAVKLLNNLMFAANAQVALDIERIARELGVDRAHLREAIALCSGRSRAHEQIALFDEIDGANRVRPFLIKDVAACAALTEHTTGGLGPTGDLIRRGPLGDLLPGVDSNA